MAKEILAAENRLAELNGQIVETRKKERNVTVVIAVMGSGTIAAFLLSALWIF